MLSVNLLVSTPRHPLGQDRTRSPVAVLAEPASLVVVCTGPLHPSLWLDDVIDLSLHDDGPGEGGPWPAQVGLVYVLNRNVVLLAADGAVLEDDCGRLAPVGPSLGGDHAGLLVPGLSDDHLAVLEHSGCVTEDEVDGSRDGAVAVELPMGLGVESVLVTVDLAVVEDGQVGLNTQCHGLVSSGSSCVLESNVLSNEVVSDHSCMRHKYIYVRQSDMLCYQNECMYVMIT